MAMPRSYLDIGMGGHFEGFGGCKLIMGWCHLFKAGSFFLQLLFVLPPLMFMSEKAIPWMVMRSDDRSNT